MIAIKGSIQNRNYEDKNGNKRQAVEVIADEFSFCGSKSENNTVDNAKPATDDSKASMNIAYSNVNVAEGSFSLLPEDSPFTANDNDVVPF